MFWEDVAGSGISKQATDSGCQERLTQGPGTGSELKHSPVQKVDNVGVLLVLQEQDLIHSSFPVLPSETHFLDGHLKGHCSPYCRSLWQEATANTERVFLEPRSRAVPNCLGMGHQSSARAIPTAHCSASWGLLTGHMARDIGPCKLCRNGPSAVSLKALTTFSAPTVFSNGLNTPIVIIQTHFASRR